MGFSVIVMADVPDEKIIANTRNIAGKYLSKQANKYREVIVDRGALRVVVVKTYKKTADLEKKTSLRDSLQKKNENDAKKVEQDMKDIKRLASGLPKFFKMQDIKGEPTDDQIIELLQNHTNQAVPISVLATYGQTKPAIVKWIRQNVRQFHEPALSKLTLNTILSKLD
jgi:hypothetical protein